MNKTLLHRLATIERNQPEETFFTLCKRWRDVPESRNANGGLIQTVKNVPYIANKSVGWHTRPEFYDQFMGENSELAQFMNG